MNIDTEVIVVGAGPSGLMIANELAQAGVRTLVLEKRSEPALSRSGVLQPRVMEIFDSRGLAEPMLKRAYELHMKPEVGVGIWAGFPGIDYTKLDSPYPYIVLLTQIEVELILADRAIELGAELQRNTEVTGVRHEQDYVEVDIVDQSGTNMTLKCLYAVGADGGRSTVRQSLGIKYVGHGATHTMVNMEVELDFPWPNSGMKVTDNIHGWGLALPMKDGVTRFTIIDAVDSPLESKDAPVDIQKMNKSIERIFGKDFGIDKAISTSRFTNAMFMAEKMREGRVFLVGESVRIHYPASGVGMNFCLQDAFNLGWKLAAVVKKDAPESLLDSYETERKPTIEKFLNNVRIQTAIQLNYSEDLFILKRFIQQELLPLEQVNNMIANQLAGLSDSYGQAGDHSLVGRPLRDIEIIDESGRIQTVYKLLREQKFLLIDLTGTGVPKLPSDISKHIRSITGCVSGRDELKGLAAILIRPDGHVAWVSEKKLVYDLPMEQLQKWFT